jgi:hypothetical protein
MKEFCIVIAQPKSGLSTVIDENDISNEYRSFCSASLASSPIAENALKETNPNDKKIIPIKYVNLFFVFICFTKKKSVIQFLIV